MRVHRLNLYDPKPQGLRCISYDKFSSRLAVSRSDSSIDIWDVKVNPYLEKIIPGTTTSSVEALAWCKGRLFSAGLYGSIIEYDLETLLPKYEMCVISGCSVWCMKFNYEESCLAIGNDDGYVSLHHVCSESLDFEKKFDKQEGAIVCLDWHKEGQIIVTGSSDAIRVWDVNTGHVINRIILARATKKDPTVVWCITITSDMTIISGDSCGKTSFWDGNTGTLIFDNGVQKNDVLSLALNEDEDILYTSGVDSTITSYVKCKSNDKWIRSIQRVVHSHDVRALHLVGDYLVSGGDDCNLVFTKYPPKTCVKFFPFCQKSYSMAATYFPCILLTYPTNLDIWSIVTTDNKKPSNVLRLKPKESERVISSSISANSTFIAYSTQMQIRVFSVKMDKNFKRDPLFHKVPLPDNIPPSRILVFTSNPVKLILYAKSIFILKCDSVEVLLENTIDTDTNEDMQLMDVSNDDTYLACSYNTGNITIYNLHTLKVHCKLPKYKFQATAIKFDPCSENLIVAYSDRKLIEYSLKQKGYTWWCKDEKLFDFQTTSFHPVNSICFCKGSLYLQDENSIYVFESTKEDEMQPGKKKMKQSEGKTVQLSDARYETNYGIITKHEHLSSLHSFMGDLVLIQISADRVLECLPPPVWKKKFGT